MKCQQCGETITDANEIVWCVNCNASCCEECINPDDLCENCEGLEFEEIE